MNLLAGWEGLAVQALAALDYSIMFKKFTQMLIEARKKQGREAPSVCKQVVAMCR